MRNLRCGMFGGAVAAALLAVAVMSGGAKAEDYCDTISIMEKTLGGRDLIEKKVREKCKVGDIVFVDTGLLIPRLCDLHQPIVRCGSICPGGDQANFCFLAPPHKTY